jgi:hypothetical protein
MYLIHTICQCRVCLCSCEPAGAVPDGVTVLINFEVKVDKIDSYIIDLNDSLSIYYKAEFNDIYQLYTAAPTSTAVDGNTYLLSTKVVSHLGWFTVALQSPMHVQQPVVRFTYSRMPRSINLTGTSTMNHCERKDLKVGITLRKICS